MPGKGSTQNLLLTFSLNVIGPRSVPAANILFSLTPYPESAIGLFHNSGSLLPSSIGFIYLVRPLHFTEVLHRASLSSRLKITATKEETNMIVKSIVLAAIIFFGSVTLTGSSDFRE
jgi:hypothetical protein